MKTIDMLGKQCPVPVIEAKKVLAEQDAEGVVVKVDNYVAVQNLEKMAKGYGYAFAYTEQAKNLYEVTIDKQGKAPPAQEAPACEPDGADGSGTPKKLVVAISKNAMGEGSEELGKILIKGFIYSLTELATPPYGLAFFNSGAYLTSEGANTIEDLAKLAAKGTKILTCGTCINYYNLQDKLAVGEIANMFGITELLTTATSVINI